MRENVISLRATRSPSALLRAVARWWRCSHAGAGFGWGAVWFIRRAVLQVRLERFMWMWHRPPRCMSPFQCLLVSVLSGCRESGTGEVLVMSGLLGVGSGRLTGITIGGPVHGAVRIAAIAGRKGDGTMCRNRPGHRIRTCSPATRVYPTGGISNFDGE